MHPTYTGDGGYGDRAGDEAQSVVHADVQGGWSVAWQPERKNFQLVFWSKPGTKETGRLSTRDANAGKLPSIISYVPSFSKTGAGHRR